MLFDQFLNVLRRLGLEFFGRFYGPYAAIVISNRDPMGLGRVQVECPRAQLASGSGIWLMPMISCAGKGYGQFWPPVEGDAVFIFFENGDPIRPYAYIGGWFGPEELPEEFAVKTMGGDSAGGKFTPERRGWKTPGGNLILLDDTSGEEQIHIRQKSGKRVLITKDAIQVGVDGGSYEPVIMGDTFKQWAETHTHPHSWGPTGPPVQKVPPAALSKVVKVSG